MATLVVVKWTEEGKYQGIQQPVLRRCVLEKGDLVAGQEVRVKLGKSSGARVWKGCYIGQAEKMPDKDGKRGAPKKEKREKVPKRPKTNQVSIPRSDGEPKYVRISVVVYIILASAFRVMENVLKFDIHSSNR